MAAAAIGSGWLGSGIGRLVSLALDKTATSLNWFNVIFEALLGALLLTPLVLG
jgi:hypothetical protein